MVPDVRCVMTRRASAGDCLRAGGQSGHIADRQRLGVENLLAAGDRCLLRIPCFLPWCVDGENVRIELLPLRIAAQRVVDAGIILLLWQVLWPTLGTSLSVQISCEEIVVLRGI